MKAKREIEPGLYLTKQGQLVFIHYGKVLNIYQEQLDLNVKDLELRHRVIALTTANVCKPDSYYNPGSYYKEETWKEDGDSWRVEKSEVVYLERIPKPV